MLGNNIACCMMFAARAAMQWLQMQRSKPEAVLEQRQALTIV